jgi:branched-chain amino acid transport system ATP-binding protein
MGVLLEVDGIDCAYGSSQVLFGMSLAVGEGQVVTLLGRNGMGKTTTVRSIMGLMRPRKGAIRYRGVPIHGRPSYKVAQAGIGLVPEGRQIFPNLSVYENLVATASNRSGAKDPWTLERVYALFPSLASRRDNAGNQLSGGEQQMLAVARALMTNPGLLILDEATEGLAPLVRAEIWRVLMTLKAQGLSILLIDKNVEALTRIADRHVIIEKGHAVWTGTSDELRANAELQHRYLGV